MGPVNVLLTGASGFVGKRLVRHIDEQAVFKLTCAVRHPGSAVCTNEVVVKGLSEETDWCDALAGQATVIHTAARAHIMKDEVPDPLAEYRKVNVEGTRNLARQAAKAGVSRFIYISSIASSGSDLIKALNWLNK